MLYLGLTKRYPLRHPFNLLGVPPPTRLRNQGGELILVKPTPEVVEVLAPPLHVVDYANCIRVDSGDCKRRSGSTRRISFTFAGASTWPSVRPSMSVRNSDWYPR